MTAILPRPAAPSTPNPLPPHHMQLLDTAIAEVAILRYQLGAVVDAVVAEQMVVPRNKAEHPYTLAELAQIEADYRKHWAQVALHAIPAAKEQS